MGRQSVPTLRDIAGLLYGYWYFSGGMLVVFAIVSVVAARAYREKEKPRFIGGDGRRDAVRSLSTAPPSATKALIVGRDDELVQMQGWFKAVREGKRRIVFVAGEPGIGKTTFTRTFLDAITAERGIRIGRGQCVEQYGAGEPYMPVLSALTQLGQGPDSDKFIETLHRLAPAWLAQLTALLTVEERSRLQREVHGVTQPRMLREMAQALEALSGDAPLILFLEDLHWSDFSTLELIGAIARRTEPARLLILGTYRPVDMLAVDHPLRRLRAELELHQHCDEMRLKLLSEADIEMYLAKRFGKDAERSGLPRAAAASARSGSSFDTEPERARGNDRKENDEEAKLSFPRADARCVSSGQSNGVGGSIARGIPDSLSSAAQTSLGRQLADSPARFARQPRSTSAALSAPSPGRELRLKRARSFGAAFLSFRAEPDSQAAAAGESASPGLDPVARRGISRPRL